MTASTGVGPGDPANVTLYSQEGGKCSYLPLLQCLLWVTFSLHIVPLSAPPNVTSTRRSPTSASVQWDDISLEDLRGWLVSYEIGYESVTSDGQCPAANVSSNTETLSVDQEMHGLTGLDPGLQYCVRLAGRTSAGVGPFSHTLISCIHIYPFVCCCYYLYHLS